MGYSKRAGRIIAMIIGLMLLVSQSVLIAPNTSFGLSLAGVSGTEASGTQTVLAFTSDVHTKATAYTASNRLGTWIDKMNNKYGHIDAMSFAGDMAEYNVTESQFWTDTQNAMDVVSGKGLTAFYTTGNHEYDPGNFTPAKNATTARYSLNTEVKVGYNYRIYCLGSMSETQEYTEAQITSLTGYLNSVGNDKPIFIVTHYPLHYVARYGTNSERITAGASDVIGVLNNAATGGTPNDPSDDKKIVFLWGHNHTNASWNEDKYDEIFKPGAQLQPGSSASALQTIDFYYAAAGCMSDSEKGSGSAAVKGKGLIITVDDNGLLTFTYYDANSKDVTEGGSYAEPVPVAVTDLSIDEADGAGETGLSVETGRRLQLHATVEPSGATCRTVTWSSGDPTVATVDSSGKVKGVSVGQTTITAALTDSVTGNDFTADVKVSVTQRSTSGTPYVLTNTLTPGKKYIIASASSGEAYALMNDNGSVSSDEVVIDGDTIYTDDEDLVFTAQGSGTTISDLCNGGRYLKASSEGLQLNTTAGSSRPWEYSGSNHTLRNYKSGSNPSYYYVYYEDNGFTTSKVTGSSHIVYLFKEAEPDVSYNVSFKVENGKWNDNSDAEKKVVVTGPADSVALSADQIPAVGNKPDNGYKAGSWNPVPSASTVITGNTTYTYTYAAKTAPTYTAPGAKSLTYSGYAQDLISKGTVNGGTMYYALGNGGQAPTNDAAWSTSVPKGTNAGSYDVYFRIKGDDDYLDVSPIKMSGVAIAKASLTVNASGYRGIKDGNPHGIKVTLSPSSSGAVVYYSTSTVLTENNYAAAGITDNPAFTDAGKTTVYYYIHVPSGNYRPSQTTGSAVVDIYEQSDPEPTPGPDPTPTPDPKPQPKPAPAPAAPSVAPATPAEIQDLPNVKISKPAKGKKAITVKWKKVSKKNRKRIAGIEVQITGPGVDKVVTAGKKKTSKKIKGLLPKQAYSCRVRTYNYIGGVKHVSAWSNWKTAKTK